MSAQAIDLAVDGCGNLYRLMRQSLTESYEKRGSERDVGIEMETEGDMDMAA